jgi:hypothetical protein
MLTLYIAAHRIVHYVYNYMFRPCILTIVRLYCKINKQLYNMCVGDCGGGRVLVLHLWVAWFWTTMDRC